MALDTSEVATHLQRIFDGAKGYFEKGAIVTRPGHVGPLMFPASVDPTPGRDCAQQSGGLCHKVSWREKTWMSLGFEILKKHRFNYALVSSGEGQKARFVARAVAKIPGSSQWLVIERRGEVDPQNRVHGPPAPTARRVSSLAVLRMTDQARELADCRMLGWVPKREKSGQLLGGKKPVRHPGKGKTYCAKVWRKGCSDKRFAAFHPISCRPHNKGGKNEGT